MKLLMDNGTLFKKAIDSIKDLVAESMVNMNEEAMSLVAMDSSHVSVCSLHLNKSGFTEYTCDEPVNIGMSMTNLSKLLKCAKNDDSISMEYENNSDKLSIEFKGSKKSTKTEMNLMEIDQDGLEIPEMGYPCKVTITSSEFSKVMKDLKDFGDTCEISVSKDEIIFSVSGEVGKVDVSLETKEGECEIEIEKPIKLKFAMRYLSDFSKTASVAPNVLFQMGVSEEGEGLPLLVNYDMGDKGFLKYFLAPKSWDDKD